MWRSLRYLMTMLLMSYSIALFFIGAIAPGFARERLRLALSMNRIILSYLLFLGLLYLSTGIFQSYRHLFARRR